MKFVLRYWALRALLLVSATSASLVDDILNALDEAVTCTACHALFVPLKALAELGDAAFIDAFTTVCTALKVEDDDVCIGIGAQQGPIIANDLRNIDVLGNTATALCDALLGLCQAPAVNQYTFPLPKAPLNKTVWKSTGKAPFQVMHFSDVHIDRQYAPGSETNCTKPICCRNNTGNTSTPTVPAGPYGEALKCDPPVSLSDSMLEFAQTQGSSAKFSIFTGDVIEAAVWSVVESEAIEDLKDFSAELASKLQAPVYPAMGNHDTAPVNSFPRNTTSNASDFQWVFDNQSNNWEQWINSTAADQVVHMSGSYSIIVPGTNLRIISYNTQYMYRQNYYLYDSDTKQPDPNGILSFIAQELQATEDAGQRAWIIGHVPPGSGDAVHDQSNYYDQIVQRYSNSIASQFFGHSHLDQFEIAYSDYSKRQASNAVSFASLGPSLTPRSGNPAFKVYDVDPDTFEIMDIKVYYANSTDPAFENGPQWGLYYSARDTYGPLVPSLSQNDSLSPGFWHNVTEAFASNDTAFQIYNTFMSRGLNVRACDADCKSTAICGMRAMRAEDNCVVFTPAPPSRKRDVASSQADYERCESINIGIILQKLVGKKSSNMNDLHELSKRLESSYLLNRKGL